MIVSNENSSEVVPIRLAHLLRKLQVRRETGFPLQWPVTAEDVHPPGWILPRLHSSNRLPYRNYSSTQIHKRSPNNQSIRNCNNAHQKQMEFVRSHFTYQKIQYYDVAKAQNEVKQPITMTITILMHRKAIWTRSRSKARRPQDLVIVTSSTGA